MGYSGMISQFLSGCLCTSTWKLDQPEVTRLWSTVIGIYKNSTATSNAQKRTDLIATIKAAAPILSGPTSLCANSCKTSIVAIFDTVLALVPKIRLSDPIYKIIRSGLGKWGPGQTVGFPASIALPANSAAKTKLGANMYDCLCSGWDYGAMADAVFEVPWYAIFGGHVDSAWRGIGQGTIAGGSPWVSSSFAIQATSANRIAVSKYNSQASRSVLCACSASYVSGNATTQREPGCGDAGWCYVAGGTACPTATPSTTYPGAAWSDCVAPRDMYTYATTSDPSFVLNKAATNIAIMRSSLCASKCLNFLTDSMVLGLQTAANYYWYGCWLPNVFAMLSPHAL